MPTVVRLIAFTLILSSIPSLVARGEILLLSHEASFDPNGGGQGPSRM